MQMQAESEQIPFPALASTTQAGGPAGASGAAKPSSACPPSLPPPTAHYHTSVLGKGPTLGIVSFLVPFIVKTISLDPALDSQAE